MKIVYSAIFLIHYSLFSMITDQSHLPEITLLRVYRKHLPSEQLGDLYKQAASNPQQFKEEVLAKLTGLILDSKAAEYSAMELSPDQQIINREKCKASIEDFIRKQRSTQDKFIEQQRLSQEIQEQIKKDVIRRQEKKHQAQIAIINAAHTQELNNMTVKYFSIMDRLIACNQIIESRLENQIIQLKAEIERLKKELDQLQATLIEEREIFEKRYQLEQEARAILTNKIAEKKLAYEQAYQCPICLMPMKEAKVSSNCNDNFHLFCIKCSKELSNQKARCPVCRKPQFSVFRQVVETPLCAFDGIEQKRTPKGP